MTELSQRQPERPLGRVLLAAWLIISLAAFIIALAKTQIDRTGTPESRAENFYNLWPLWLTSAALWIGLTLIWRVTSNHESRLASSHAPPQRFWRTAFIILGVATVARVAVLLTHQPSLSDDIYRYIFDGRNLAAGLNPYLVKPADRFDASPENWPGEKEVVDQLVYRELPTPYLPASHYVFGAAGAMGEMGGSSPQASALTFRIVFIAIELGMIALLLCALRSNNRSPWWVALYAWHPLAISEIAGSGHQDIIGIALLVAALALHQRKSHRIAGWSALLSLSGMVKPIAIPSALFMLHGKPWRDWIISFAVGAGVALAVALPLRWIPLPPSEPFQQWSITAREMGDKWAHFAGVYEPIVFVFRKTMHPPQDDRALGWNLIQEKRARWVCTAILLGACIVIWRAKRDVWKSTAAFMLALVLLSSTAHPWYLLWALALCPLAMSRTLWIASLTIPWGYVVFATGKGRFGGEEWTVPAWTIAIAYVPIFIALAIDLLELRTPPARRLPLRTPADSANR